jgi:hypothetical protein
MAQYRAWAAADQASTPRRLAGAAAAEAAVRLALKLEPSLPTLDGIIFAAA